MVYVGSNIKWLRKRAKKSQTVLAEQFFISRGALNSYEHGAAKPHLELLLRMSDYFGLSVDVLIREDLCNYHELQFRQLLDKEHVLKQRLTQSISIWNQLPVHTI